LFVKHVSASKFPAEAAFVLFTSHAGKILVNAEDYDKLHFFNWTIKKSFRRYYAGRWRRINGQPKFEILHRIITRCPSHLVVHHLNNNTLDNRRANLQILTPYEHKYYHSKR